VSAERGALLAVFALTAHGAQGVRAEEVEAIRHGPTDCMHARCLNDAPCPPFTSHGASIMLQ
jgi:hypothetical protein